MQIIIFLSVKWCNSITISSLLIKYCISISCLAQYINLGQAVLWSTYIQKSIKRSLKTSVLPISSLHFNMGKNY